MKKILLIVSLFVLTLLLATTVAAKPPGDGLEPGEFVTYSQDVPINLVFIGYDDEMIDEDALRSVLPDSSTPRVRYPPFYGLEGRPLGLNFDFDYNFIYADRGFETRFFRYLDKIGVEGDPSIYQEAYNAQASNVLDVTGPVLYIDAPSVEAWLAQRNPVLGINPRSGYTVYFINWYGRHDFQFHLYTKTDVSDPDTGVNFGEAYQSRFLMAWGGEYGRTWFYDLSAGPEWNTTNYIVDFEDLDGNGVEDYRMPPIWEYTAGGYRDPAALSSDLGLITRFVGINLLFTSSPLYDPMASAPAAGGSKIAHVELFEDDPASSGLDWIDRDYIHDALSSFQFYYPWQTVIEDNDPIDPGAQRAFHIFTGVLEEDDCWNAYGDPFAELFCYFDANYDDYVPAYGPDDYTIGVFSLNTTAANMGGWFGLLGFADDDWATGTPSYIFQFNTPDYNALGYGLSTTTVHEVGHHLGLSHPHDGYDPTLDIDYGPGDDFYYVWVGDESDTVMHYLALSNYFGRFDQDDMYRWHMAGYLNWSNELLGEILAHPDSQNLSVMRWVKRAEQRAILAQRAFERWDYSRAVQFAYDAYLSLAMAAEELGIETPAESAALTLPPIRAIEKDVDYIRDPGP